MAVQFKKKNYTFILSQQIMDFFFSVREQHYQYILRSRMAVFVNDIMTFFHPAPRWAGHTRTLVLKDGLSPSGPQRCSVSHWHAPPSWKLMLSFHRRVSSGGRPVGAVITVMMMGRVVGVDKALICLEIFYLRKNFNGNQPEQLMQSWLWLGLELLWILTTVLNTLCSQCFHKNGRNVSTMRGISSLFF